MRFRKTKLKTVLIILIPIIVLTLLWNIFLYLDDCHHINEDTQQAFYDDSGQDYLPDFVQSDTKDGQQSSVDSEQLPAAPEKGYHIHINLDNHTMYVFKDGQLLKTYPVSGGKQSTPSPLGTWKIISKDNWGEGFGGAWMGFNVPWGKYGIHGTYEPWFVGKSNSSKGCIRMKNKDVNELFKIVPHGTTVTIVQQNRAFRNLKNGDIGSDVAEIQKALKKLGYYPGYIDGKYGNYLADSVKKFQKDNKLYTTGVVNISTYELIKKLYNEKINVEQNVKR